LAEHITDPTLPARDASRLRLGAGQDGATVPGLSSSAEVGQLRLYARRLRQHRLALTGCLVILLLTITTVAAPLLTPYDPEKVNLPQAKQAPSLAHPFGTDELGRDVLARCLYGGRVSLSVALLAVGLGISLGTAIGLTAGFYGGAVDNVLMRLVDIILSLPRYFLLIMIQAFFTPSPINVILVIGATSWMQTARIVRSEALSIKGREFFIAAKAVGARTPRLLLRHILPNTAAPIIVASTLGIADAILIEASLSFLGLGIPPQVPTWGNMLMTSRSSILKQIWWTSVFPGGLIALTMLSFNFAGDGLRDVLDPRQVLKRLR
jgi:peptide/nickel transport system permease protein